MYERVYIHHPSDYKVSYPTTHTLRTDYGPQRRYTSCAPSACALPTTTTYDGSLVQPLSAPYRKITRCAPQPDGLTSSRRYRIGGFHISRKSTTTASQPPPHNRRATCRMDTRKATDIDSDLLSDYVAMSSERSTQLVVERRNERLHRVLRITQSDLPFIGSNTMETEIKVYEMESRNPGEERLTVIFCVKHAHTGLWPRQTTVHKNLMVACALAGVISPLEIPLESIRLFKQNDAMSNIHNYMERVMHFIRTSHLTHDISAFWWRPIGNGVVIIQNMDTGQCLFIANEDRPTLETAVATLERCLTILRETPQNFMARDPYYPCTISIFNDNVKHTGQGTRRHLSMAVDTTNGTRPPTETSTLPDISKEKAGFTVSFNAAMRSSPPFTWRRRSHETIPADSEGDYEDREVESEEEAEQLIHQWADEDGVTPQDTCLVLRIDSSRRKISNIRYSIGKEDHEERAVTIQVHRNEPFSRELKAFPLSMRQIIVESKNLKALRLAYERALFFIRKIFTHHLQVEGVFVGQNSMQPLPIKRRPIARAALRTPRHSRPQPLT